MVPVCAGLQGLTLVTPGMDYVQGYADALAAGWSPSTLGDSNLKMLQRVRANPEKEVGLLALYRLEPPHAAVTLHYRNWWLWDGDFCGLFFLVNQPGSNDLPPHVLAHVGYNLVPAKRGQGYATRALRLAMPLMRAVGLSAVRIACRPDNVASWCVVEKAGGVLLEQRVFPGYAEGERKLYELAL